MINIKDFPYWLKVCLAGLIFVAIFIIIGIFELRSDIRLYGSYTQLNIIYLIAYPIIGFLYVVLMFWIGNRNFPKWIKVGFFVMGTVFIISLIGAGKCLPHGYDGCRVSLFELSDFLYTIIDPILGFIFGAFIGRMMDRSDNEIKRGSKKVAR
ncbi:hypothetical protein J4429_05875 [Candidatus Pacearchaeota archaeon]|nr:hypothetical protein [Candidatus Pacearchaeota archaeon]